MKPRTRSMQAPGALRGKKRALKQPDVLMLLYLMRQLTGPYNAENVKENWDYAPRTDYHFMAPSCSPAPRDLSFGFGETAEVSILSKQQWWIYDVRAMLLMGIMQPRWAVHGRQWLLGLRFQIAENKPVANPHPPPS